MKDDQKIPRQTICPECKTKFETVDVIYIDWEEGIYETFCPQCGATIKTPTDRWA